MGHDEPNLLREKYEKALTSYEAISSALNRHLREGTSPTSAELQQEREARAALDAARRAYLEAWMP